MIIGLLLTALLLFIVPIIFRQFNIPGAEIFSFSAIVGRMREIMAYVLQIGGLVKGEINTSGSVTPSSYGGYEL
jgi:uncharacterized membrane protein